MDFYAEFRKLAYGSPHNAVSSRVVENGTYGDYLYRSKNIYLSYFLADAEDCFYSEYIMNSRDCIDSAYLSASELCYECLDCSGLYNCSFLQDCHNCSNTDFCIDCLNCKNCFGSYGLRHQQFSIFNKPYPEDEYYERVAKLKKNPPQKILEILRPEFDKQPRLYARLLKGGENCFGDYIYFSKNCYQCFNVRNVSDSAYVSEIISPEYPSSNCVDCNYASHIELCYECQNVHSCTNCNFLEDCISCSDSEYLRHCYNCQNCFGCSYLSNKQYCILNRQFSREEYALALAKIKQQLKETGTYGKPLAEILK